jgi:hypothetical protein
MTPTQKNAWFSLIVVLLSVGVVLVLMPRLGVARAQGGFGLLGFLGFGPLFYRKRRGLVVSDERDDLIRRRSVIIAYTVFWLAFVVACLVVPWVYGSNGAVPVAVVSTSVWWGLVLVTGVSALATLIQYGRGGEDAA